MAQIAYLLLCHKDPERVIAQARRLIAMGDRVALHFDASASDADFKSIQAALADEPGVAFVTPRRKCGWGQWSLVAASLDALRLACRAFPAASHFYLISGDCMPTKPALEIRQTVEASGKDWIDAEPFATSDFIQTGFREERLIYRHVFNERTQERAFYAAFKVQRALGLKRALPKNLTVMVGSQWWCLRRSTVDGLLKWIQKRPDVIRFFRTTWIPDETFFQTLVRHVVPAKEIEPRTPTFVQFTDYGQPVTFHNDHFDLLAREDCLFARKIGAEADDLAANLGSLFASNDPSPVTGRNLHRLHRFLTREGRLGRRHGERRWLASQTLGHDRSIVVVVCKKWHIGKRFLDRLTSELPGLDAGYLFDEDTGDLPDLGGLQDGLDRRNRHRTAFLNTLSDLTGADRIAIGIDPARLDVLQDIVADGANVQVIELNCTLSNEYLAGHATRIGLFSDVMPDSALTEIVPPLRAMVERERQAMAQINGLNMTTLYETADMAQNTSALAVALGIDNRTANALLNDGAIFAD